MSRTAPHVLEPEALPGEGVPGLAERDLQDISPAGIDRGQIRWMLSLTPTERLAVLQNFVDTIGPFRDGKTD